MSLRRCYGVRCKFSRVFARIAKYVLVPHVLLNHSQGTDRNNRGIHADVIVYILAHLHTTLRTEGNM